MARNGGSGEEQSSAQCARPPCWLHESVSDAQVQIGIAGCGRWSRRGPSPRPRAEGETALRVIAKWQHAAKSEGPEEGCLLAGDARCRENLSLSRDDGGSGAGRKVGLAIVRAAGR